jgi:hypothetical protein
MATIKPFKIEIQQSEVDRMLSKLRDTRLPQNPIVPDAGSDYGMCHCPHQSYFLTVF